MAKQFCIINRRLKFYLCFIISCIERDIKTSVKLIRWMFFLKFCNNSYWFDRCSVWYQHLFSIRNWCDALLIGHFDSAHKGSILNLMDVSISLIIFISNKIYKMVETFMKYTCFTLFILHRNIIINNADQLVLFPLEYFCPLQQ